MSIISVKILTQQETSPWNLCTEHIGQLCEFPITSDAPSCFSHPAQPPKIQLLPPAPLCMVPCAFSVTGATCTAGMVTEFKARLSAFPGL